MRSGVSLTVLAGLMLILIYLSRRWKVASLPHYATLEATQGQILSQSATDAASSM